MSDHLEADLNVAAVIKSSAVFGLFDRVLGSVWRAAASSVAVSMATATASAWAGLDARVRHEAAGTMLIVAVVAHLVFTLATQVPASWLWLVLPGHFGAIGLLLVAAPRVSGRTKR